MTPAEARQLLERIRALTAAELTAHEATLAPFFLEAGRLLDRLGAPQASSRELLALLDDLEEVLEVLARVGLGARER